jgi:hypothetical protein
LISIDNFMDMHFEGKIFVYLCFYVAGIYILNVVCVSLVNNILQCHSYKYIYLDF